MNFSGSGTLCVVSFESLMEFQMLDGWLDAAPQRTQDNLQQTGNLASSRLKMSPEVEKLSTTDGRTTGKITTCRRAKTDHIVLREWLFQHRYNAYPTRAETLILAMKTELTTKQVRNWFINARRRILPEILRREGREPERFIRTRVCSSFIRTRTCFSFFCSTPVTGPTSSTSFFSCPCSEKNALSQHQSLHLLTTCADPDQPLDLSLRPSRNLFQHNGLPDMTPPEVGNFKTFTC